jgi:hypothetical protein
MDVRHRDAVSALVLATMTEVDRDHRLERSIRAITRPKKHRTERAGDRGDSYVVHSADACARGSDLSSRRVISDQCPSRPDRHIETGRRRAGQKVRCDDLPHLLGCACSRPQRRPWFHGRRRCRFASFGDGAERSPGCVREPRGQAWRRDRTPGRRGWPRFGVVDVNEQTDDLQGSSTVHEPMMNLPDHADPSVFQPGHDADLPKRLRVSQRLRQEIVAEGIEFRVGDLLVRFGQLDDVFGDVEVRVIHPPRLGDLQWCASDAPAAPRDTVDASGRSLAQLIDRGSATVRGRAEDGTPSDVHVNGRRFNAEERVIEYRERLSTSGACIIERLRRGHRPSDQGEPVRIRL